jgi:tetratricopeptide (TPR) repeat protein
MKIGAIILILYEAIAIYDTALKFAPNDLKTLKRKGFALEKLSELQLSQQQYTEAVKALKQAIAYDSAFSRYHSDAIDISYHGMIIERLAELYLTNKQYTEAFASYQQALATYETAIQLAPVDFCVSIQMNLGSSGEQPLEETGKVRCKSGAVPQL